MSLSGLFMELFVEVFDGVIKIFLRIFRRTFMGLSDILNFIIGWDI